MRATRLRRADETTAWCPRFLQSHPVRAALIRCLCGCFLSLTWALCTRPLLIRCPRLSFVLLPISPPFHHPAAVPSRSQPPPITCPLLPRHPTRPADRLGPPSGSTTCLLATPPASFATRFLLALRLASSCDHYVGRRYWCTLRLLGSWVGRHLPPTRHRASVANGRRCALSRRGGGDRASPSPNIRAAATYSPRPILP